jgi:hypothetical protein
MDWTLLEAAGNAAMIATFGVSATFTPQDGSGGWLAPQDIKGIVTRPAMLEDLPPAFGSGTSVVRLWVNIETISPTPQHGDQVGFGGNVYAVQEIEADIDGGAVLKLRIT